MKLSIYTHAALAAVSIASGAACAQSPAYPGKPVRIITPTAAGGSLDTSARIVAQKLTEMWGQQVTIDNRPGAGGIVGADTAAKAAPDGYTMLFASNGNIATTQALYKKIPYDPIRDFAPVILVAETPYVLIVHPSLPVKTAADLIKLARTKPGRIDFASSGSGSTPHLAGELFKSMAKINLVHVPYKGSPAAHNSVVSGETSFELSGLPSSISQIRSGRLRALGVASAKRSSMAPEIPTISETMPGFVFQSWNGFFVPKATPEEIQTKLRSAIAEMVSTPEMKKRLTELGIVPGGQSKEEVAAVFKKDRESFAEAVNAAGIKKP